MYKNLTASHTRLKERSQYHPNKRRDEIARFGVADTQERLAAYLQPLLLHYPVRVINGDNLALSLVRSFVLFKQTVGSAEWCATRAEWSKSLGLGRKLIDSSIRHLIELGGLSHALKGFPAKSYYCYRSTEERDDAHSEFTYHPVLAGQLGYKAAALFGWMASMDRDLDAQGFFFHCPLGDIQKSLGLSRFQLDQARKVLIERQLLQERYWGIPAVREFRIKLDGVPELLNLIES